MPDLVVSILCTVCLGAGWYYLFQSRFVNEIATLESKRRNVARRRVRRLGAMSMIALGVVLFWGFWELGRVEKGRPTLALLVSWAAVFAALLMLLICVMADVYLTHRLRGSMRNHQ